MSYQTPHDAQDQREGVSRHLTSFSPARGVCAHFNAKYHSNMKGTFEKAWGYQGDNMNLPVRNVAAALPFYETVLGFRVLSRSDSPHNSAVLVRDQVRIGLAENGGDSTQDGCAFQVKDLEALFEEFRSNGLQKELSDFGIEQRNGAEWKVFYVVAPDGLCYWLGERQTG